MIVSYAQALEDVVLFRALGNLDEGFYVDVGANSPIIDSVTRLFYERGWRGINIEPSPAWYAKLVADRPRDINLNLAVSDKPGVLTFHEIEESGLSTIFEDVAERHDVLGLPRKSYEVETQTLAAICDQHAPKDIHFLKIDVEGAEELALRGANFERHRPWVVLVEATEPMSSTPSHFSWDPLLRQAGYEYVLFDDLNRFYIARERMDLAPYFSVKGDKYRTATAIWTEGHWRRIADEKAAEIDRIAAELELARQELAEIKNSTLWRARDRLTGLTARKGSA